MTLSTLAHPGSNAHGEANTHARRHVFPCALNPQVCGAGVKDLNQLLADTISLCDLYRKHRWRKSGPAYYPLHLLFDRHHSRQVDLVDELVERVKDLGGIANGMACEVAAATHIPAPPFGPSGQDDQTAEIARLLSAHGIILEESHNMALKASARGDLDTAHLMLSNIVGTNEMQVILLRAFLAQDTL